jgi:DNA-binding helix-hairpin-helix protein with protein kinase domain
MSLNIGQKMICKNSKDTITVIKELGSGGQGSVYLVEGKLVGKKALKWYNDKSLGNSAQRNEKWTALSQIVNKSPDGDVNSSFAWPIELVELDDKFGYIMDFVNLDQYITVAQMIYRQGKCLPTQQIKTLISLNIVTAFAKLHSAGYCYRDINEKNIVFDVKTGNIKILDNDNAGFEQSSKSYVLGVPDYMAPEILREEALPSKYTDYHSLATFLFRLWMWHYPLEGVKALEFSCWDRVAKVKVFSQAPFIFDKNNQANALPHQCDEDDFTYVHDFWKACPKQLQDLFTETFGNGLFNPNHRVIETRWIKVFGLMYDTITNCPNDQRENFWNDDKHGGEHKIKCWKCKKEYTSPSRLKIKNKNNNVQISTIIIKPTTRLLARHMSTSIDVKDAQNILGTMIHHPTDKNTWGLRNESNNEWIFINSKKTEITVPKGKSVPAVKGNTIDFNNGYTGIFETSP